MAEGRASLVIERRCYPSPRGRSRRRTLSGERVRLCKRSHCRRLFFADDQRQTYCERLCLERARYEQRTGTVVKIGRPRPKRKRKRRP